MMEKPKFQLCYIDKRETFVDAKVCVVLCKLQLNCANKNTTMLENDFEIHT